MYLPIGQSTTLCSSHPQLFGKSPAYISKPHIPHWCDPVALDSAHLVVLTPVLVHTICCRVTPRYGVHSWELPPFPMEMTAATPPNKQDMVFRWFGRLLLEGGVKGLFSELTKEGMLNDPPSLLTREMPTKKVMDVTRALVE